MEKENEARCTRRKKREEAEGKVMKRRGELRQSDDQYKCNEKASVEMTDDDDDQRRTSDSITIIIGIARRSRPISRAKLFFSYFG